MKIKVLYILSGLIFLSTILLLMNPILKVSVAEDVEDAVTKEKVVIIDAGHGGEDGGAVSRSGIVEKNINLSIAQSLKSLLEEADYKVIMTRDEDISIHDEGESSTRAKKRSDLNNRLKIINENPTAIFVSIHQNSIVNYIDSKGAQIFYSGNNEQSEILAQCIQDSFKSSLQPDNKREIKKAGNNLFILYNANNPAVMAECGFLSNAQEAEKLNDPEYQKQAAKAIFDGIEQYYSK